MTPTAPSEVEKEIATSSQASASYPAGTFRLQVANLPSLPEAHRTVPFVSGASWFRKILAFAGPGYLVAVGYMDPGNWATDIQGGSKFGYTLLIVIEGFLNIRLKPWVRRLITRALAITPAVFVIGFAGEGKVTSLIVLSQVILSFQLPFAIIPLIQFTGDRAKMGTLVNSRVTKAVAWVVAGVILFFNGELLWFIFRG